jgi:hypothetical protein
MNKSHFGKRNAQNVVCILIAPSGREKKFASITKCALALGMGKCHITEALEKKGKHITKTGYTIKLDLQDTRRPIQHGLRTIATNPEGKSFICESINAAARLAHKRAGYLTLKLPRNGCHICRDGWRFTLAGRKL